MEKVNNEVIDMKEVKEKKPLKEKLKENKKKIFIGLGLIGAFIGGAIAHAKLSGNDEDEDEIDSDVFEIDDGGDIQHLKIEGDHGDIDITTF